RDHPDAGGALKLCFLDALRLEGGAFRGCALVTDERTRPLEFRMTDPVAANALQRALYGAVLEEHLLGDLCGVPLLEALRETPDWVLVRDQGLLALQDARDEPVLWVGREADADQGIVLGCHGGEDSQSLRAAREALAGIARHYDLLEPFDRLRAAAEQVHGELERARA